MSARILGLDIGISSVGWAVVDYDKCNNLNNKIVKSGVRIFTIAENPKTGESLALPRRLARGTRRTIKRKRQRLKDIKNLFIKYIGLSKNDLFSKDSIFNSKNRKDVWQLRDLALKRKLANNEFARVLTHISKRRGYKSNRKVEEKGDSERKKVLNAISQNQKLLEKYATIGQAIFQSTKNTKIRRNKKDDYNHSISRYMLLDEINIIFDKQKEFGNDFANDLFKNEYIQIFSKQKNFSNIDDMVGTCTLEGKKEKRASKRALSSEEFVTLTKLINTKIVYKNVNERNFTKNELEKLLDLCKQSEQPTYIKIKDTIDLDDKHCFKNIDFYEIDKKTGEVFEKKPIKFKSGFVGFHQLKKIVEKLLSKIHWQNISQDRELLNEIAKIFSYHKNDDKINEELQKLEFKTLTTDEKQILIKAFIENISFNKFLSLSIKAIEKILPLMKDGKRYDEAVDELGYKNINGNRQKFLRVLNKDEMAELTNPVVKRALAQTRKIINALIREYGQFDKVHVELTREIKKSHKDRNKIQKGQEEYQKIKQNIVDKFIENYKREPRGNELLKFRLLEEQGGYCIYSQNYISPEKLLIQGYVEIDHILPFSKSLEDSLSNKVLCLTKENQDKKNRTPYEYFTQDGKDWHVFEEFIKGLKNIKKPKRNRLLKKNFDENSQKEFRERNINDTAFMAIFIKNFIEENLELKSKDKKKVITVNGTLTNMLRHSWAIGNKSRENHLHHAVDAIIIAFATQSEVQRLSTLSAKRDEFIYTKSEVKAGKLKFIAPIENFRDEVQKSIDEIFVSFSPRKSINGEAHEQTIYSPKDFQANRKQDKVLVLTGGSVVRNVKLNGNMKIAKQSIMPKIDIFRHIRTNKFYIVPIYINDFVKEKLPNKAIVPGKDKDGIPKKWLEMDKNYEFLFSVYKNELLEIKTKKTPTKESKIIFGYFVSADSATGNVELKSNDNKEQNIFKRNSSNVCSLRIGIQNSQYVKKYQVNPLGNKTEIKKEKRLGTKKQKKSR